MTVRGDGPSGDSDPEELLPDAFLLESVKDEEMFVSTASVLSLD
jgi:hypothetical protein